MSGIFVTGTDTDAGKTVASAALLARYPRARYWKPVQTGIELESGNDTQTVRELTGGDVLDEGIRLPRPLSPHLAARLSGATIEIDELMAIYEANSARPLIVEGAGGVLVPLNESTLMIDFIQRLNLPVVIVARTGLGTINHTLMTLETIRHRGIEPAGVIAVGSANPENVAAIESFGRTRVLASIPRFDPLTPERFGVWAASEFDPEGNLARFLE